MAASRVVAIGKPPIQENEKTGLFMLANAISEQSRQLQEIQQELRAIKEVILALALRESAGPSPELR